VFAAAEGVFRLLVPSAPRLAANELTALSPLMQHLHADEKTALRALSKMLASFREWVDAAHFFRHEEGAEEVAQGPLKVAVYLLSVGR
jgi:hypothetical protein